MPSIASSDYWKLINRMRQNCLNVQVAGGLVGGGGVVVGDRCVSKNVASGLTPLVGCFIKDPAVSIGWVGKGDAPKLNECENRAINSHRRTL